MNPLRQQLKRSSSELLTLDFHIDCMADGVGTLILTFYCVFIALTFDASDPVTRVASGALIGATVYGLLETFGHLQWAAINPIVATAFLLTGNISGIKCIAYILFEMAGGVAGAYLALQLSTPEARDNFSAPSLAADVTWLQGFGVTTMITSSPILVIIGSLDDVNRKPTVPALAVGATTAVGIIIGAPHSAGISNQAVCFGISAVTGIWEYQELFWAGGYTGCFLAFFLYTIFSRFGGKDIKRRTANKEDRLKKTVRFEAEQQELGYKTPAFSGMCHQGFEWRSADGRAMVNGGKFDSNGTQ